MTLATLSFIHKKLCDAVAEAGGLVTDIFFCPHLPEDRCECRKPRPGLIHQAARKYEIDLEHAVMVGDSARDIECGKNAGCSTVLVLTGNGPNASQELDEKGMTPDAVTAGLEEAAEWIISQ
jgi:histidinol-phosphate phosphatase family protein